jgi:hypothetical protein
MLIFSALWEKQEKKCKSEFDLLREILLAARAGIYIHALTPTQTAEEV